MAAGGPSRRSLLLRAGVGLAAVMASALGSAFLMHASIDPGEDRGSGIEVRNEALAGLASWGIQLTGLDVAEAARSPFDLLVVDELAGGAPAAELARKVKALQARGDGSRRLVLAHLAIGGSRADRGEHRARFWEEAWQARIVGGPSAVLDRILAAGFDGIYIDHGDVHVRWAGERARAGDDVIALVERISQHAREWRPGFVVVLENGGRLLERPRLRSALDAVAASDLLYAAGGDANPAAEVAAGVAQLKHARRHGLLVLAMEHLTAPAKVAEALRQLEEHGFVPYFGPRDRDRLVLPPQD